jgi:hypothetical protein
MKCVELEELLSAYIDGEITEREKQIVEEHLETCRECGELLVDFSKVHSLYGELDHLRAPQGFRLRVAQRVDAPSRSWFVLPWKMCRLGYAFSILLLVMLVGSVLFWQVRERSSEQSGETLLAGEIEVFAEDILFGDGLFDDVEALSEEGGRVADNILDDLFLGETDSSGVVGNAKITGLS